MTPEERTLISGLFDRLRAADANAPAKDHDAEELIRQLTAQAPSAPYLLTQTILVQEHALTNAQARIQTLEKQLTQAQQQQQQAPASSSGGGFLSGLFGGHSATPPQAPPPMPVQPQAPPYPSTVNMAPSAGSGFLRGALSTAAGVAGGALLFQGIENLLGHNSGPFGSFGSFGGGGGFLSGGARPEIIENREIVNNYYNDDSGGGEHHHQGDSGAGGGDADSSGIPLGGADQPAHPGYEDVRSDDNSSGADNPFDRPVDDNSFFATQDNSSLDNNYDLGNTDAGNSDLGGGNDFVGGDSDDDRGAV